MSRSTSMGVYGAPIGVYPGYYYGPPAGVYFGTGSPSALGSELESDYGRIGAGLAQLAS